MTKKEFLKLNREIGQLPPDLTIQKEYMDRYFEDMGLSLDSGYKAVQYYYAELYKAKEGQETFFTGKVVIGEDHFGIVDAGTCIFKMTFEGFENRKELFFPTNSTKQILPHGNDEIDFNQTSPEYYLNIASELDTKHKVKFICDRNFLERNGALAKGIKIGDIGTRPPDYPKNPNEAFLLFKNYFATSWLLTEVAGFLNDIYDWNEKAIREALTEVNKFIDEAEKIPLKKAYEDVSGDFREMQKRIYLRLKHGSYYKQKSIEYDNTFHTAKIIYGKYFLFRDLLESKINIELKVNETDNSKKGNEENPKSEIDAVFLELKELVKYSRNDANWNKLQTALDACTENIKNENFKKIQFAALFSIIYHLENEGVKIFRGDSNFKKVKSLLDIIFNTDSGSYKENKLSKPKDELIFKYRWINLL